MTQSPESAAVRPTGPGSTGTAAAVSEVADRFRSFIASHGGTGTALCNYLGRRGVRIVVVAADGRFADAVVDGMDVATACCDAAGMPIGTWDRELTNRITVSAADRVRMAGTGR
ncbi:MAG: hypothetical protein ACR2M5_15470 [Nakamurella sp.]